MDQTALIIILAAIAIGFGVVVIVMNRQIAALRRDGQGQAGEDMALAMLKADMQGLQEAITQGHAHMSDRVDRSQQMMHASLSRQFSESARLITDVTRSLTELKETNRQVVSVTDELKLLQNVLQNPKQRGVLGEYYLQSVLENVLPPGRFELQCRMGRGADGREMICDAVILLEEGKRLPVDSKFSLENYNRLIEEGDKSRREALVKLVKADLKERIDETSKYIQPERGTMDFAFMFIPSEAIYYDLLTGKIGAMQSQSRDLIEYAFREKRVIIVSPTSFMAYLQTVLQGLRSLQIEEKSKDIQMRVGQLAGHLKVYEEFMQKMGSSLGTTVNHYNNAAREFRKVDKDIMKIAGEANGYEPVLLERPQSGDE